MSVPILFVGDSPVLKSGLGRIGRDLAFLTSRLPEFRVGYFGRGGYYTRSLPFPQYCFQPTSQSEWGEVLFPFAWRDFVRGDEGILFSIWDPSRVVWIGYPHYGDDPRYKDLAEILAPDADIYKWGYFAIDGSGPPVDHSLTRLLGETLLGYDRVLAYGHYGSQVITSSMGSPFQKVPWLPHGINLTTFQPRDRKTARQKLNETQRLALTQNTLIVGCVMTNQPRKDWGALMSALVEIKVNRPRLDFRLVCRTDSLTEHWDLRALVDDFGLLENVRIIMEEVSDEELSWFYSACDLTVLPSLGEGFGYPIVESLACGVPVIHVNYAGGAELVRKFDSSYLLGAKAFRLDTRWNIVRPVLDHVALAELIVDKLFDAAEGPKGDQVAAKCRASVEDLDWQVLWPKWREWLLEGLQ